MTDVFTDETTDLRPSNAAAQRHVITRFLPNTLSAAGTSIVAQAGVFSWQDDKNSPRGGRHQSGVCAQDIWLG